ncbi:hypothetical protein AKJ57_02620 [candidate division MSBL1 archaeon SCGC-AAA259A05]|uniref:EamA domain-containing protein n=1 Tax=candidate division MSBL1 archaeon SCGC-AAA259A05 TaxID=1698259 RepID=A0A133UA47_9EURY|nr:hypothetical protein AKJ57_02620 [candidate division MSBL1 archaeon SCGC-AAA259A05]
MKTLVIGLGFGAIMCWSLNSLMIDKGLKNMDVYAFNAIRTMPATALIILFMILTGRQLFVRLDFFIMAFITGVSSYFLALGLFVHGLGRGFTHKVWPVGNSAPLWATISAILFLGEKATLYVLVATSLVISGIYLLSQREFNDDTGSEEGGVLLAFLAALIWGLLIVPNKYCLNQGMSPFSFLYIMIIAGMVSNVSFLVIRGRLGELTRSKNGITWGIISGIVALFLGGLSWQIALSIEEASRLVLMLGAESPIVLLLSVTFLKERPSKKSLLGIVMVFLGVFLVTWLG